MCNSMCECLQLAGCLMDVKFPADGGYGHEWTPRPLAMAPMAPAMETRGAPTTAARGIGAAGDAARGAAARRRAPRSRGRDDARVPTVDKRRGGRWRTPRSTERPREIRRKPSGPCGLVHGGRGPPLPLPPGRLARGDIPHGHPHGRLCRGDDPNGRLVASSVPAGRALPPGPSPVATSPRRLPCRIVRGGDDPRGHVDAASAAAGRAPPPSSRRTACWT